MIITGCRCPDCDPHRLAKAYQRRRRGWRVLAMLFGLALLCWLSASVARSAGPELVLWWNIANSNASEPGSVGWNLRADGWRGFVEKEVKPALAWCEASGVTPAIELHLAFGHWRGQMHLDNHDFATASGERWMVDGFAQAWRPVSRKTKLIGYVGSIGVHPDIVALPPSQLAETICRNVRPFLSAGFERIVIDHTSSAISHGFVNPTTKEVHVRSLDAFELAVIDSLMRDEYGLPNRAEIEAAPTSFREWRDLSKRDCWMLERFHDRQFGPWDGTPEGDRIKKAAFDGGRGTTAHLKGRVHRMLSSGQPADETLKLAQEIAADGHVPCVQPRELMKAGIKASDVFTK